VIFSKLPKKAAVNNEQDIEDSESLGKPREVKVSEIKCLLSELNTTETASFETSNCDGVIDLCADEGFSTGNQLTESDVSLFLSKVAANQVYTPGLRSILAKLKTRLNTVLRT
jgi:glutathionyl-hydroquinone reductase